MAGTPLTGTAQVPAPPSTLLYILRPQDRLHRFGISSLALTPDLLFTGGRDGVVRSWRVDKNGYLLGKTSNIINEHGLRTEKVVATECVHQLDDHSDWVNGLIWLGSHERLISCSSDTTLKVWGKSRDGGGGRGGMRCIETLDRHTDYVKAVDILDESRGFVASGSLDGRVLIWDVGRGEAVVRKDVGVEDGTTDEVGVGWSGGASSASKSVYALAAGAVNGRPMVAAGGAHKFVHVWDLRTDTKDGPSYSLSKRAGSTKALKFGKDGTLLAGGPDRDVTLWDLRIGKKPRTYQSGHLDSVWAMQRDLGLDSGSETVLTGGRDGRVCATYLDSERKAEYGLHGKQVCIVEEADSDSHGNRVLDVCATHDEEAVYVATTGSTVRCHRFSVPWRSSQLEFEDEVGKYEALVSKGKSSENEETKESKKPSRRSKRLAPSKKEMSSEVVGEIRGMPGIVKAKIANDRRRVLTMDSSGGVKVYDVTSGIVCEELKVEASGGRGTKVRVYGEKHHEDELEKVWDMVVDQFEKRKEQEISIPSWFSVDIRTGSLGVKLSRSSAFNAAVYAPEAGVFMDKKEEEENNAKLALRKREEIKANIGCMILKALFTHWKKSELERRRKTALSQKSATDGMEVDRAEGDDSRGRLSTDSQDGTLKRQSSNSDPLKPQYTLKSEVTVIVKQSDRAVPILQKKTTEITSEDTPFLPAWVKDAVLKDEMYLRDQVKVSFALTPAPESELPPLTQVNLTAIRILRIRKVSNFVCSSLRDLNKEIAEQYPPCSDLKEEEVEILCEDRILPPQMSLATAKQFVWKNPGELKLMYRRKKR